MRLISRAVEAPILAGIVAIYLVLLLESFSARENTTLLFVFPLVLPVADFVLRHLSRRISDNVISRKGIDASKMLTGKKDFELRREAIGEFLMKSPMRGWNVLWTTGSKGGYLKITPKYYPSGVIEIKTSNFERNVRLRDLVIRFSSREPKVRAMEFSYGS